MRFNRNCAVICLYIGTYTNTPIITDTDNFPLQLCLVRILEKCSGQCRELQSETWWPSACKISRTAVNIRHKKKKSCLAHVGFIFVSASIQSISKKLKTFQSLLNVLNQGVIRPLGLYIATTSFPICSSLFALYTGVTSKMLIPAKGITRAGRPPELLCMPVSLMTELLVWRECWERFLLKPQKPWHNVWFCQILHYNHACQLYPEESLKFLLNHSFNFFLSP